MSPALICQDRGWKPGDVVEGPDAFGGVARVRITAIGEGAVLGVEVTELRPTQVRDLVGTREVMARGFLASEAAWSVSWADWRRIELAADRPEVGY